ncbi:Z-ring formation inhibitor MciZ [Peribacillus saganii]|uniref:Z-ring formation inhibitor MciZ n=1 Tax=Peribacillus saganii TaxID=2303992 RepID=A0A372LNK0_9BACI|nr:Z-ring formation inhibitor MciZ [Peribacillus saganii]RFU67756.1 Z-ring formation inhibitor MciZ [Peribacillus saganii]
MKVYVLDKGIVLAGKGWEIQQKLKEFRRKYVLVNDWISDVHSLAKTSEIKRVK